MSAPATILRSLGLDPARRDLDSSTRILADRLARAEQAVAAAEKRGAVKALRAEAARFRAWPSGRVVAVEVLAESLASTADRLESGEVTP